MKIRRSDPSIAEIAPVFPEIREKAKFLFRIDETNYYELRRPQLSEFDIWKYENTLILRRAVPGWLGFAGITGFDAANVALDALAEQKAGQSLKQTILERRVFAGAQSEIRFDPYGDAVRETYMTIIRNGTFVRVY
mgnify:CR=1 FL=1